MLKKFLTLMLCLIILGQCLPIAVGAYAGFDDVAENAYYASAVEWAVAEGITAGITPTTFGPNRTCTRGQAVSFIWRAKGCPEPVGNENPFTDVKESDYFYKPVLWAVENGITAGMTPTTFGPNMDCTRGQIVTFLWNTEGKQVMTAENPFTDVKESHYFYNAVLWAVEKNITAGMSATTFAPNNKCTRAQIVCFLERCYNKNDIKVVVEPADYYMTSSMEDATFTVEIEGGDGNYYYDWFVLKDNNEVKVSHGATSATSDTLVYEFSDYDFDDYRDIAVYCVITDVFGNTVTTRWAEVFSKEAPKPLAIITDPVDYQMTSSMEDAAFTVEIEGGVANYYYDWYIYKDNDETKISHGATSATVDTLTFSVSDYDFEDYREIAVRCVVTDIEGNSVGSAWASVLQK